MEKAILVLLLGILLGAVLILHMQLMQRYEVATIISYREIKGIVVINITNPSRSLESIYSI
jgi:hypothetical protein